MKKILIILFLICSGALFSQTIIEGTPFPFKTINSTSLLGSGNINVVISSEIIMWKEIIIDTSMLADSSWLIGYSSGIVLDTLIYSINSNATSPTATPYLQYGTNYKNAGTAVITTPSAVTSKGIATKLATFNHATIANGNWVYLKFKGSPSFKMVYVGLKGHRQ